MKLMLKGKIVREYSIHANVHGIKIDSVVLDYKDFCELQSASSSNLLVKWIEGLASRFVSTESLTPNKSNALYCPMCEIHNCNCGGC